MKKFLSLVILISLLVSVSISFAATGCNYPGSLDSFTDKQTGDFLTVADVNARSCAIEQLESRLNQLLLGKSGSQQITGGTGASESLALVSTSHGTKGKIFLGAANSAYDEANVRLGIGTQNPSFNLHVLSSGVDLGAFHSTSGGAIGPGISLFHDSASPAALDLTGLILFLARDTGGVQRQIGAIQMRFDDPTNTSMDSSMLFNVMDNVNQGNVNTVASLDSLGTWNDASTETIKHYEGDFPGSALAKLKQLTTLGIYRGRNIPQHKIAGTERHYGPTAEEFFKVFGLGKEGSGWIAAKDAAWIAARAVQELEARVSALEAK